MMKDRMMKLAQGLTAGLPAEQLRAMFVPAAIARYSAMGGAMLWLIAALGFGLSPIQILFLIAPLVIVPLGLPQAALTDRDGQGSALLTWLIRLQPLAALLLWVSFAFAPGELAAMLALPWVLLTFACGLYGVLRHLPHGFSDAGEVAIDAAFVFIPVGGAWLLASRLGQPMMGFHEPLVLLTAVHFHFAGFAATLLTGLTGRLDVPRRLYRWIVAGVISGIPLLAVGIAFLPWLEVVSAAVFAVSLAALALLWLQAVPRLRSGAILLTMAASSILISMGFALTFALAEFLGRVWVTIPQMAALHGALNAVGFALPALIAFLRLGPVSLLPPPGIPFSRLASQGFVGPEFFHRLGAVPDAPERVPTGLVDDMNSFRRPGFDPGALAPAIRHFYEHTDEYVLWVVPYWQRGFVAGGKLWRVLTERIGQMCLPIEGEKREDRIDSVILPLSAEFDGRENVRAWVRTYTDTGRAVYVAAYAQHAQAGESYMNIAFTLPLSQMSSILRLEGLPVPDYPHQALSLTTLPAAEPGQPGPPGDMGVYLVASGLPGCLPIRLPLNETISVWTRGMPGFEPLGVGTEMADAPLLARHDMWIFGIRFLTLHYFIFKRD